MNSSTTQAWPDDVMRRHLVADFIYNVIQKRHLSTKATGSICMALDGDWGSGKSFFIERWVEDLKRDGHAVIRFDSWKNDLSDDPLVGLLATLQSEARKIFSTLDVETKVTRKIEQQGNKVFKKAKSVLAPASIEIAKGVAAKFITRAAIDAMGEILAQDEDSSKDEGSLVSEKSLEKVFEKVLDNHVKKQTAIADFTKELAQLALDLETLGKKRMPIYICIDELDRCRPTYAISLLEGVKHLFNAKGVCFVFSTNLGQLSESVKAVYGPGFNGHMYLKRFFEFDYQLPPPNNEAFAKLLLKDSLLEHRPYYGGFPSDGLHVSQSVVTQAACFSSISKIFGLDLRSQQQVFIKSEAVAGSLPTPHQIHLLYLFALAAIQHKSPTTYTSIQTDGGKTFSEKIAHLTTQDITFSFTYHDQNGSLQSGNSSILATLEKYHLLRKRTQPELNNSLTRASANSHPGQIAGFIFNSLSHEITNLDYYNELIQLAANINNSQRTA